MKNHQYLFILIIFYFAAVFKISASEDTLKNDLVLVKPMINFNEPNGGYYSDYIECELNTFFSGAVVQNCGVSSTTDFYLEFSLLTYDNKVIDSYQVAYKDTLLPGIIDTLYFPEAINFDYWDSGILGFLTFTIKNQLADVNTINNTDTVPLQLWWPMWSETSRANIPTNSLDLSTIPNFNSGDFIGSTIKIPNGEHWIIHFGLYFTDTLPNSVSIIGEIYQNGELIHTFPIDENNNAINGWHYTTITEHWNNTYTLQPNDLYYAGISLDFPDGVSIPIGVDTSLFHNFEAETIARIGDKWTILPFVPLIALVCDPEGINSKQTKNQIPVYPNPTNGIIYLDNVLNATIELFDLSGKLILKQISVVETETLDLSSLDNGNYLIKITNNEGITNKIITIIK